VATRRRAAGAAAASWRGSPAELHRRQQDRQPDGDAVHPTSASRHPRPQPDIHRRQGDHLLQMSGSCAETRPEMDTVGKQLLRQRNTYPKVNVVMKANQLIYYADEARALRVIQYSKR